VIEGANIPEGSNAVWHAWTYNGTVPGPTLYATAGDTLVVTVFNTLNLTHSFHTHLFDYNFEYDGSQANVITGIGAGAMIPPGGNYTYVLNATTPGIYFYHCHSSDHHMITYHIHQGLYGAIIVDPVNKPHIDKDFVVFMGEMGPDVTGTGAPPYIMNGMGIPGGEGTLEKIVQTSGVAGVLKQANVSYPAFSANVGQTARFNVINIGDQVHTFHMHDQSLISEWVTPGQEVPGNTIPLDPGTTDSVLINFTQPGVFLFHCHVVIHADEGMIGLMLVSPANVAPFSQPRPSFNIFSGTNVTSVTTSTATIVAPSQVQVSILLNAGTDTTSPGYSPQTITVVIGVNNTVTWTNNDNVAHTVTSESGAFDSGNMEPGQSFTYTFTQPGTYTYYGCSYHSWMNGTVIVVGSS
jgi:nitrite reductase (NO-forming)